MKAKQNRFPIGTAVILFVHLLLCIALQMNPVVHDTPRPDYHPAKGIIFMLTFLVTFAAMASEMRLFTRKTSRISNFAHEFLPCLTQIVLIAVGEMIAAILLNNPRLTFWSPAEGYFWAILCAIMLLLIGIVIFVTGAARTMLYHDEKR